MPLVESFSGIRGIYDDGMDEQVTVRYGYAYLSFLKKKYGNNLKVVIGTDTRPSRDILKNALIEAFDCEIIDLGIVSTPMTEFAVRRYKANGGIVVTASHNEPYWNGFKFLDKDGAVLKANEMGAIIRNYHKLKKLSNENFFNNYLYKNTNPKKIKIKKIQKKYEEINKEYSEYVLGFLSNKEKEKIRNSKFKVIIDPNGGSGIIAKQILEKLNVKVMGINMEHGVFNRAVEPNEDSLLYLSNMVRDSNYDFAAGFDCDADRVEIMAATGLISGNQLLALIADDILKKSKNKVIVVNDATSFMVRDIAKKHNAKYVETEVGEINVVNEMHRLKAPVGGEGSSSGVIIPDSRCRDGILTLLFLIKIIANKGKKIEELIRELPQYYNLKTKATIDSKRYDSILKKIYNYYKRKNYKIKKSKEGSLKVMLDHNSFIWFRASRTEANLLRVIADAQKKEQAELIVKEALKLIK
ncbi:hypothetical protein HYU50_04875 [Candidatus Woesearchaeota archaeon]|nr:hypothetical protein [Candidatus Woesearchaeota archaeon]